MTRAPLPASRLIGGWELEVGSDRQARSPAVDCRRLMRLLFRMLAIAAALAVVVDAQAPTTGRAVPLQPLAQTVRLVDIYRQAAVQAGRQPRVVLMRDAWVATSRAEAEAMYGPEVMMAYRYYWEHRLAEFRDIGSETELTLDNLAHDRLILGEPETCVREFHRWQEATGADYFLLRLRHAEFRTA